MATDADIDRWVDEPRAGLVLWLNTVDEQVYCWCPEETLSLRQVMDKLRGLREKGSFIAAGDLRAVGDPTGIDAFVWVPHVTGFSVKSWGQPT